MLTKQEKKQLLAKSQQLDINITMYMKATNVLNLNVDSNEFSDFLDDITNPVYYTIDEEYYDNSKNYYWIIDPQVLNSQNLFTDVTFKANTKNEFWTKLQKAIDYKQKETYINK